MCGEMKDDDDVCGWLPSRLIEGGGQIEDKKDHALARLDRPPSIAALTDGDAHKHPNHQHTQSEMARFLLLVALVLAALFASLAQVRELHVPRGRTHHTTPQQWPNAKAGGTRLLLERRLAVLCPASI